MPIPESYWGIQLPDGYIPVSRTTANQVLSALRSDLPRPVYLEITSLIGSTRFVVLTHVLEVFESTPEQRDANREYERMLDKERSLFKALNPDWSSDD